MVGRLKRQDLAALALGVSNFLDQRGHILDAAAVGTGDRLRAQADRGARGIHGYVSAANHTHALAAEVGAMAFADVTQQLHGRVDAVAVLAVNADFFVIVCADGDVDRVKTVLKIGKWDILADRHAGMHLDAGGQDKIDIRIQLFGRQAVIRNAVAQHTAELGALVKHNDLVPHERQKVGRRQAAGPAADHADGLAGRRSAGGCGPVGRMIAHKALDAADVDRVVYHAAAAARFTGVLAYIAAYGGEGVVLADQTDGIVVAAGARQRNIARNIHPGGAERHTGHGLVEAEQTAAMRDV